MSSFRVSLAAALVLVAACADPTAPTITSVAFATDAATLLIEDSLSTSVTVSNSRGETVTSATVTYASSAPNVASVDATGKVRAITAGTATISASVGSVKDELLVTVAWPPVQTVAFSADDAAVLVEDTLGTIVTVTNTKGKPAVNAIVTYSSSAPTIATVDQQGRIAGVGNGTATITASAEGLSDQLQVTVAWPPIVSITFSRDTATLLLDDSLPTVVTVMNSRGRIARNAVVTYTSSDIGTASVDATGKIRTFATGATTITASVESFQDEMQLSVAPHFTSLALGEAHTCGIAGTGILYCWGSDNSRQLGGASQAGQCQNAGNCSKVPVPVAGTQRFVSVTAGALHTCALTAGGAAYCWGDNTFGGQIGNGSSVTLATTPTLVSGGLTFASITAGRFHTCGITTAGDSYCWGWDFQGQLGAGTAPPDRCGVANGQDPCSRLPVKVVGSHTFTALVASAEATCGRKASGEIYCWGFNVGGAESTNCQNRFPDDRCTRTPLLQGGGATFAKLIMTYAARCGQAITGELSCWGFSGFGEFGNGTAAEIVPSPISAAGGAAFGPIAAGMNHLCGAELAGAQKCWGRNEYGAVGDGTTTDRYVPTTISGGLTFSSFWATAQASSVCALSSAGRAYCWGWGTYGSLGDGANTSRSQPVLVKLVR